MTMALSSVVYQALKSIVGPDNISQEPEICTAYSRGGYGDGLYDMGSIKPACIVLPGNTEEVQAIVRLANRYKFPYIPISTFFIAFCIPLRPNTVIIHLKRMDNFEIDAKNQCAIVEPYVTFSQLQIEAMKRGLFTTATMAGAQISVLVNHIQFGAGQLTHRTGVANRRILAAEWVLPNGELLKTGSWTNPKGVGFWGEGPGPDLRGLLRGYTGALGGMGICTKLAVKLTALPKPFTPVPYGVTPQTTFAMPGDDVRWYVLIYKTLQDSIDAMYKICHAEICAAVMRIPSMWRTVRKASSREEFWRMYEADKDKWERERFNVLRVGVIGFASKKQTEYEEKVLQDIAQETGGQLKRVPDTGAADCFQPSYTNCAYRPGGLFISEKLGFDSIDHALTYLLKGMEVKRRFFPVIVDDKEEAGWILSFDFGHHAHGELTSYHDNTPEDLTMVLRHEKECIEQDLDIHAYTGFAYGPFHEFLGPRMGDYHLLLKRIKSALDKDDLANPGRFAVMDKTKERPDSYFNRMYRLWHPKSKK
jgi:hypothetical protein